MFLQYPSTGQAMCHASSTDASCTIYFCLGLMPTAHGDISVIVPEKWHDDISIFLHG